MKFCGCLEGASPLRLKSLSTFGKTETSRVAVTRGGTVPQSGGRQGVAWGQGGRAGPLSVASSNVCRRVSDYATSSKPQTLHSPSLGTLSSGN